MAVVISRSISILVLAVMAVCVLPPVKEVYAAPHINPAHGVPEPPPRVTLPPECDLSPEQVVAQIDQGLHQIPNCDSGPRFGRAVCCAAAKTLSNSGCEKVLDTAMQCCRLRFPVWMPSSLVEYACGQAMYQIGISDVVTYCYSSRDKRLADVGCAKAATPKQAESAPLIK
jgi:hypothetical protein